MATGEFELIERIRELVAAAGAASSEGLAVASGDDASVTTWRGASVTSVDALVEGVHFLRSSFPLRSIGRKALAVALSDLAAMGAAPGEVYVQLGLPGDLDEAGVLELAQGLAEAAAGWGVAVAGGDVTRAPSLFVALTAVGHVDDPADAVTRAGARAGDVLAVTGELGGAAAALLLDDRPELGAAVEESVADALRRRQLEPEPRLGAGRALAAAGATAMIDLSDGLGGDAAHMAEASGVRLVIDVESVPVQAGVADVAERAGVDPLDLALSGGEDYELLAALPADALAGATSAAGVALTAIGTVEPGASAVFRDRRGRSRPARGFDQLRPQAPGAAG